jgi:hypothetical protein
MSTLEVAPGSSNLVPSRTGVLPAVQSRRTARSLAQLEHRTLMALARNRATEMVRLANVETEAIVASAKLEELAHVGRVMVTEYTMLRRYSDIAASGDPLLIDELKFMTDTVRLGMAEVAADLVTDYCRERRQ